MVRVLVDQAAVTPAGRLVGVPLPVTPVVACVILGRLVLMHKVGVDEASPTEFRALTVIDPVLVKSQPLLFNVTT